MTLFSNIKHTVLFISKEKTYGNHLENMNKVSQVQGKNRNEHQVHESRTLFQIFKVSENWPSLQLVPRELEKDMFLQNEGINFKKRWGLT